MRNKHIGDTGEWRLVVDISSAGLKAYLKNTYHLDMDVRKVVDAEFGDSTDLLSLIEQTVYDNPTVLDDYEADIVMTFDNYTWLPRALAARDGMAEAAYNSIFGEAADADIMTDDNVAGLTCVCMPVPGLRSFLSRTFPGARFSSHASLQAVSAGPGLSVWLRTGSADIVVKEKDRLVFGATKAWTAHEDVFYHILNALGMHQADTITLHGDAADTAAVKKLLAPYFASVHEEPVAEPLTGAAEACLRVVGTGKTR